MAILQCSETDWQKTRQLKETTSGKNRQDNHRLQESSNNCLMLEFFGQNVNQNCQSGNVQPQTNPESNAIGLIKAPMEGKTVMFGATRRFQEFEVLLISCIDKEHKKRTCVIHC